MKIGLALAGGGVKGAGHIGALKALTEAGIEIEQIGGTSIGSIVATLYAMGYSTDEMLKLFKYFAKNIVKINPKKYLANATFKRKKCYGIISSQNIEVAINECAELKKIKNIKDIKMPIVIPTVDIKNCTKYVFTNHKTDDQFKKEKYINNISIGKAVRASASYPGVFEPMIYDNHKFVDGGLIDNLPIDEIRKLGAKKVLSIRFDSEKEKDPNNIIEVIEKSLDILFNEREPYEVLKSDYSITLTLSDTNIFDSDKIDEYYINGYNIVKKQIENIKKYLKN